MGIAKLSNPEATKRRESKKVQLKEAIARELAGISGRKTSWSPSKCAAMDEKCYKEGKRCVLWSDSGNGWYVLINWDWSTNQPRAKDDEVTDATREGRFLPGYYEDLRKILKPPLLDGTVPPDRLAEWIDRNTISVHHGLIERLTFINPSN